MATGVNEMKVTTVATGETRVMAAARVEVATAHVSMEEEGRDRLLADALVKPEGIDFSRVLPFLFVDCVVIPDVGMAVFTVDVAIPAITEMVATKDVTAMVTTGLP